MLERLGHLVVRRRKLVIAAWAILTIFGAFSAQQVSKRWFQSFSIPGYSAYETNQRALKTFGTGEQAPLVAVFRSKGDVTRATGIERAIAAGASVNPGAPTSRGTGTPPSRRSTRPECRTSARRCTSTRYAPSSREPLPPASKRT